MWERGIFGIHGILEREKTTVSAVFTYCVTVFEREVERECNGNCEIWREDLYWGGVNAIT